MDDAYHRIGEALKAVCGEMLLHRGLLYSEVEEGVISVDVFLQELEAGPVEFRFGPKDLKELIYSFWESGSSAVQPKSWRTMCYIVEGPHFKVALAYPGEVNQSESLADRRPRTVRSVFGGAKVNYSRPRG